MLPKVLAQYRPSHAAMAAGHDERSRARLGPAAVLLDLLPVRNLHDGVKASPDLAGLAAIQGSMMRNYFRLVRAQQELEHRARRAGRGYAAALIDQVEAERARLAHDLHSGAGQALAGIKIHLELIDIYLQAPPPQVRNSLHRIGLLAQEALQQVRSVARSMHPPDWERLTLREALERLWEISGVEQKFEASLCFGELRAEPPHHARVLLYRVAQESLANAIRHSGARRLSLAIAGDDGFVRLSMEDDGKGFDAEAALARGAGSGGIGLQSMRDQLRWVGGELRIESGERGTRVTALVPLSEAA